MPDLSQYAEKDATRDIKNREARERMLARLEPCARDVPGWFHHEWMPHPEKERTYICRVCSREKHETDG